MKKIFRTAVLAVAAIAALSSCSIREMGAPEAPANRIKVTVNAGFDQTKTQFGTIEDGVIPVTWSAEGEQLILFEVADGVSSQSDTAEVYTLENGGANAKFQFALAAGSAKAYDYFALYPASARRPVAAGKYGIEGQVVDFAWTDAFQLSTADGPDPDFCLVMSSLKGLTAQPTELNMQFQHFCGYGKVAIKDLKLIDGEKAESLTITFDNDTVVGRYALMPDGSMILEAGAAKTVKIDLNSIAPEGANFEAWFAAKPFTFNTGDKATVVVTTNKRAFTKEITATADLSFEAGVATAFTVDMSTAEAPEVIVADKELVFDFLTATATLPSWPTSAADADGEYVYPLDGVDYSFYLYKTFATTAQITVNASGSALGLPVIQGHKLVAVICTSAKGKSSYKGSISSDIAGTAVVKGGETQNWASPGNYTYKLEETAADTRYYIYGVGPLPISKLTLYYIKDGETPVGDQIEAYMETVFAGGKSAWAKGDVIGVLDKIATTPFVAQADGASVNFSGTFSDGTEQYAAIYPYNEGMGINASNKVVVAGASVCPAVQTVADGSTLPIYATFVKKGDKLAFKPLGAAIKFTIDSDYAGKFSAIKFTDPSGKAMMTGETTININLETGNAASKTAYVTYAPENGNIGAGTYYLGIYTPNNRYTLSQGLVCVFTMTTGQSAELVIPADVVGASAAEPGMIFDLGTLKPELPGMATYSPYNYPAESAPVFQTFANMLYNKASVTVVENVEVVDGVVVLKGVDGVSTAGAKIGGYASDGTAKTPAVGAKDTFGNTYFTTTNWKAGDYIRYEIPVGQTVKGDIAFTFSLSCGKANVIAGNWKAEWSKDNATWETIETIYTSKGIKTGTFCINDNGTTYNNGVSTAKFNIPDAKALQSGDKLYVKLTLDTDATNASQTLRMNGGCLVYPWPTNLDLSADPNVILFQNFSSLCKCSYDVLGVYNGDFYSEKGSVPAIEGWGFGSCHERLNHIIVNGNATTTGYILTPALTALTDATDIIVTFKASAVENPSVGVDVVGAGTVDPDGPFWTKALADSPYNWTVCYVKISGADATTQVKITSNANLDVDDIVITK